MKSLLKLFKDKDKPKSKKDSNAAAAASTSTFDETSESPLVPAASIPASSPSPGAYSLSDSSAAAALQQLRSCAVCTPNKANPYRDLCQS